MKVCWDSFATEGGRSGVSQYSRLLSKELTKHAEIELFKFGLDAPARAKLIQAFFLSSKSLIAAIECDIFHGLANFNIPLKKTSFSKVLTVHDLIPLVAPSQSLSLASLQLKYLLPKALKYTDAVVCISDWTNESLLERYPWVEDKLIRIPNGIPIGKFRDQSEIDPDFPIRILTVSRFEAYKNLESIIELLRVSGNLQASIVTDTLGVKKLESIAKKRGVFDRLKLYSQITEGQLSELYLASHVYVHPSSYEGFGLPIVEAHAFGLPVVYQKGSATDETAIGCWSTGLQHPDLKLSNWIDSIEQHFQDLFNDLKYLQFQKDYCQKQNWSQCALTYFKLYNELVSQKLTLSGDSDGAEKGKLF